MRRPPRTPDTALGAARADPSLLRDGPFLRLWSGTTASGLATWAMPFVLGLAVLDRSLSAGGLGLVLAARTAGFLVAVPVGGVLADRHARRGVVRGAALAAAAATPVVAAGLGRSVAVMAVAAVVVGAGQGACRPAFQALPAEVVAAPRRRRANAAMSLAVRVTTLVAPAGAALLAVVLSPAALLLGTGLLWLAPALLPPPGTGTPRADPAAERVPFHAEFAEGVREAGRHPWFLAGLAALTTVIATGYSATGVILPLVSRDRYGSEAVLAAALTAYTVGALAGALLVARRPARAEGWAALAGLACYGFAPLGLLLPGPAALVVVGYFLAGAGIELFNVPWFTATQREVAPDRLARVSSLDFLLSYGLAPVGLALIAPAADTFGTGPVLGVCARLRQLFPTRLRHSRDGKPVHLHADSFDVVVDTGGAPVRRRDPDEDHVLVQCVTAAPSGGGSFVLDAYRFVDELAETDPELWEFLTTADVDLYGAWADLRGVPAVPRVGRHVEYTRAGRRVVRRPDGAAPLHRDPDEDHIRAMLARFGERVHALEPRLPRFTLAPGEVLLLDNYRCWHGRDAHTGDRVVRILTLRTDEAR
ncbi:MFS transporter [Streptomyces specialis]|uniref:MFS transporter n=1 Tax=Streptomyces specialis TaxID=498367 RepID=UPI00099E543C|nr:MFS transporter [Streptomyces specialis]